MSSDRVFIVDIEPSYINSWKVWIGEEPYRGAITDADLPGERQRIGGAYTSRHLVGKARSEWAALRMGRKALAAARNRAAKRVAEWEARQQFFADHKPIRITSDNKVTP